MKTFTDLSGHIITELDAVYLVDTTIPKSNYNRLHNRKIPYSKLPPLDISLNSILVIAEAKHSINTDKIALKLWQFDRIVSLLQRMKTAPPQALIKTIQRNPYLTKITDFLFFFGAAFWEKGLITRLRHDVNTHKSLSADFTTATSDVKIDMYKRICNIQRTWYGAHPTPM